MRAALAVPDTSPPRGAVIVLHEALGLNDDIRGVASRFAANGYLAMAPDFLDTGGPRVLCLARFMAGVGKAGGRPYRDLEAARRWLVEQREAVGVALERVGVVGFCVGGGFALTYAATADPPVTVAAPFYSALPRDPDAPLARLCPVVAGFGGRDRIFGRNGARLEAALEAGGIDHDVVTYPDAGHSYMNRHGGVTAAVERLLPTHGGYDPQAAEDSWRRMLAFFERHLAAPAVDA